MTSIELSIMSLLAEQPQYGYSIEKIIEDRGMRAWTEIGFSSIYYILSKLEKMGWVQSIIISESTMGPAKKVYQLTEAGDIAWREAAIKALSQPRRPFHELDLGLANLPLLGKDASVNALTEYRLTLIQRLSQVTDKAALKENQLFHVQLMFDRSICSMQAELLWLESTINQLQQKGEGNG